MSPLRSTTISIAAAGMLILGAVTLLAQYQVSNQLYRGGGPPASVRYAPQYLGGTPTAPSSARLLPSEVRNGWATSGALPSDIRMGYASAGPLAPTGPIAYIPTPQAPRSSSVTTGNYMNYSQPVSAFSAQGSIRYGGIQGAPMTAASPVFNPNPSVAAARPSYSVNPGPIGASTTPNPFIPNLSSGSIRYGS